MTYQELINTISATCLNHKFVESFGVGKLTDINMGEDSPSVKYPHLFLIPNNLLSTKQSSTLNFQLIAMTKTYENMNDYITSQSEMTTILHEIVSLLDNYNDDFVLSDSFTITPFSESYKDVLVGSTLSSSIKFKYPFDKCNAPTTGLPITPSDCPTTLVIDGDGSDHYVEAGGSYECLPATAKSGVFYQRQIPWDGNDPGIVGSVFWHIGQGTYDYTPPTNPLNIALKANGYEGNDARCLLQQKNRFDNFFRFTNDVGQQFIEDFDRNPANTSTYPSLCIDNLTGLMYFTEPYNPDIYSTLVEAIDYANNFSYGGFDDWRLADVGEYLDAVSYSDWTNSYGGVYAPFVDTRVRQYGGGMWLGSFTKDNQYIYVKTNGGTISLTTSTTAGYRNKLMVRNFYE